jgi:hypothetical protein
MPERDRWREVKGVRGVITPVTRLYPPEKKPSDGIPQRPGEALVSTLTIGKSRPGRPISPDIRRLYGMDDSCFWGPDYAR